MIISVCIDIRTGTYNLSHALNRAWSLSLNLFNNYTNVTVTIPYEALIAKSINSILIIISPLLTSLDVSTISLVSILLQNVEEYLPASDIDRLVYNYYYGMSSTNVIYIAPNSLHMYGQDKSLPSLATLINQSTLH